jgi:methylthioxylose transferase
LFALSAKRTARFPAIAAAAAGLLLGWAIFLNYGLTLMAILAAAVLISAPQPRVSAPQPRVSAPQPRVSAPQPRAALTAVAMAVAAVVAVIAVFTWAGFWWVDGYTLVQQRYWQGIAGSRPFQYWSWANLASVVCAIGLGSVAGISRVFDLGAIRSRSGIHLLVLAALIAIACADLSMLSKAETERIWLPFTVWLTAAPALLPRSSHRWWLALNIVGALLLNHFIFTNW